MKFFVLPLACALLLSLPSLGRITDDTINVAEQPALPFMQAFSEVTHYMGENSNWVIKTVVSKKKEYGGGWRFYMQSPDLNVKFISVSDKKEISENMTGQAEKLWPTPTLSMHAIADLVSTQFPNEIIISAHWYEKPDQWVVECLPNTQTNFLVISKNKEIRVWNLEEEEKNKQNSFEYRMAQVEHVYTALRSSATELEQVAVFEKFDALKLSQQWILLEKCIDDIIFDNQSPAVIFDKENPNGRRTTINKQGVWFLEKIIGKDLEQMIEIGTTDENFGVGGFLGEILYDDWLTKRRLHIIQNFINKKTPEEKLNFSRSEKTPREVLAVLANDPDKNIRLGVIQNPYAPSSIIVSISESEPDENLRNAAKERLDSQKFISDDDRKIDYTIFDYYLDFGDQSFWNVGVIF